MLQEPLPSRGGHLPSFYQRGFTLIELSIVLVIIGLIVGGVLVGQDLIRAATERAQITQIEKFNAAASTFFGKFGFLPGDITASAVTQFGFTASPARTGGLGTGDGNGSLSGLNGSTSQTGENIFFWEDLSANSQLIDGSFNAAIGANGDDSCRPGNCNQYFPDAKIGNGASVYVYSGYAAGLPPQIPSVGPNFFGVSTIPWLQSGNFNTDPPPLPSMTELQAYHIDKKIDDGLPTSGNVLAQWLQQQGGYFNVPLSSTNGASASSATCYDTSSGVAAYSITNGNGNNANCGLSFKMQAGN